MTGPGLRRSRLRRRARLGVRVTALLLATALIGYLAWAGVAWLDYGHARPAIGAAVDPILDRFMPRYDIAERHEIRIAAPAAIVLETAKATELERSPVIRAIFRTRARVLGARREQDGQPTALLAYVTRLGWGTLADVPDRELVMGAVTQPWQADVVFRALPPAEFAAFNEPGFVKIAWTLRADPLDAQSSIFRTETRAIATDAAARARFRFYWARFSPGIVVIRRLMLGPLKEDAEGRARARPVS